MEYSSLEVLKPKDVKIIKDISGGCSAKKRLYELGLNKGTQIEILKNDFGPIILNVSGFKLAIGRGLASQVLVG
ncbi:MAG TPA: FeoA family protein [Tissierellaceae bacterium]|nr:FeoA family protein [Tissierellaceae bacterium]